METTDFFRVYDKVLHLVGENLHRNNANMFKYNSDTIGIKKGSELICTIQLTGNGKQDEIISIVDEIKNHMTNKIQPCKYVFTKHGSHSELTCLQSKILIGQDRQQFGDIIKCYESGILRAGYLLAWLMLVESLKGKIFRLADLEVKVAKQECTKIKKSEEKHDSTDVLICDAAKACEIISDEEREELRLLWNKRCIMGHPYTPHVKESDFFYMVEKLVEITLSKPLMWSKPMIDSYFEDIKKAPHLIPISQEARIEEINLKIALIPERLYPYFWKTLFCEFSKSLEESDGRRSGFLNWMAVKFLRAKDIDINDAKYCLEKQIKDYPNVCWRVLFNPKLWNNLDMAYKDQLFRYLNDKSSNNIIRCAKRVVEQGKGVSQIHLDCYYRALSRFSINNVYDLYVDKDKLIEQIYDEKISTCQFTDQGDYVDLLKSMGKDIEEFSNSQKERLGYYLLLCYTNNTWRAQNYVTSRSGEWFQDEAFIFGFIREGIITDDEVEINNSALKYTVLMLKAVPDDMCHAILDRLSAFQTKKKSNNLFDKVRTEEILNEELSPDSEIYKRLAGIAEDYYA